MSTRSLASFCPRYISCMLYSKEASSVKYSLISNRSLQGQGQPQGFSAAYYDLKHLIFKYASLIFKYALRRVYKAASFTRVGGLPYLRARVVLAGGLTFAHTLQVG